MPTAANSVDEVINNAPDDRKEALTTLRKTILKNLPKGFAEAMSYGMPSYVVPHSIYPAGYHCKPSEPLPFASFASQKGFIAFYHMGLYGMPELMNWFTTEYPKHSQAKLDMGKSCIRFKKPEDIPFKLIGELMKKVSMKDWISFYEATWKKERK